jgi:NADPH-dependent 2,4-dienoyl-CoA reductase/sulfur reductase-like enzyme
LQVLLKSSALLPDVPFVLAGSGPLLYLLAAQCLAAGARPAAILDTTAKANEIAALRLLSSALMGQGWRYLLKGLALKRILKRSGVTMHRCVTGLRIEGSDRATGVSFLADGKAGYVDAAIVALHEGVIPAQQMARSIGCDFIWNEQQGCFVPVVDRWGNSSVDGILIAGDGAGISGAMAAEHDGQLAALETLRRLGRIDAARRDALAETGLRGRRAHTAIRRFLDRLYAPPQDILTPADDVLICRCEEITAGALRAVVGQGCQGPNQAKSFLRTGMGPCQGRLCGPTVSAVLAQARGVGMDEIGYFRVRPPLKPITVGEIADIPAKGPGNRSSERPVR